MLVTGFPSIVEGIISSPDAFLSHSVIATASPSILYFKLGLTDTASGGLVSEEVSSLLQLQILSALVSGVPDMRSGPYE